MPNADEYEEFGAEFDALATSLVDLRTGVCSKRDAAGVGGEFGELVDAAIDAITSRFSLGEDDLRAAGRECRRRVGICEDFDDELDQYRIELRTWRIADQNYDPSDPWSVPPGVRPVEPTPPYDWVEAR